MSHGKKIEEQVTQSTHLSIFIKEFEECSDNRKAHKALRHQWPYPHRKSIHSFIPHYSLYATQCLLQGRDKMKKFPI